MMFPRWLKALPPRFDPWILALLHGALALSAMWRGMDMRNLRIGGSLKDVWQAMPVADMHWSSFWWLHAQPPGYSLWCWFWVKVAGEAHYQAAIHYAHIALGVLVVLLAYSLTKTIMRSRRAALAVGFLLALNPALFFFEAYLLYEMIVVTLVTASAWILERAVRTGRARWLVALAVVLNVLVLSRSFFHLILIPAALACAWPLWRGLRPARALALLLAALVLPAGWYAKNARQYGFFGSSSWFGWGVFRCVVKGYDSYEMKTLCSEGVVSQMAANLWPYDHAPGQYRRFGFTRTSPVPLLSHDDLNNVNVPDISRQYLRDSKALIRLHPGRYLECVLRAYEQFSLPVSRFSHHDTFRLDYIRWEPAYALLFYGGFFTDVLATFTGVDLGSLFFFYFPLLLAGGAAWSLALLRRNRRLEAAGGAVEGSDRSAPWVVAYIVLLSVYTVLVGTLFEYGENVRFRFAIEPLHFMLAAILIRAAWVKWAPASAQWPPADRSSGHKSPGR